MHTAIRFRSVGFALATAGALFSVSAASAQPLAMTDPSSRYPASIFQEVMPRDSLVAEPWDYVITVCDSANERCPVFPRRTTRIHWSFEDPSRATGSDEEQLQTFRRIRDEIMGKLRAWLSDQAEEPG